MRVESRAILDFFRDAIGRFMIILGASFLLIALLLMTRVYQLTSCWISLLGVALIVIGSALHFESFKWKVPSVEGFATFLIYVAPLLLTAGVATIIFAVPTGEVAAPRNTGLPGLRQDDWGYIRPRGPTRLTEIGGNVGFQAVLERPFVWLTAPLMQIGLSFLVVGFLLRFVRDSF